MDLFINYQLWSVHSMRGDVRSIILMMVSMQAHRIISQIVFTGARVFGRAFTEAYKQAAASQVSRTPLLEAVPY